MDRTTGRVPGTRHRTRFITSALLAGAALAVPALASASFLQLVGTTQMPFATGPVSEPASLLLLGSGLAATAWLARRRTGGAAR